MGETNARRFELPLRVTSLAVPQSFRSSKWPCRAQHGPYSISGDDLRLSAQLSGGGNRVITELGSARVSNSTQWSQPSTPHSLVILMPVTRTSYSRIMQPIANRTPFFFATFPVFLLFPATLAQPPQPLLTSSAMRPTFSVV